MCIPQKQKIIINLSERFVQDFWPLFLRLYVCVNISGNISGFLYAHKHLDSELSGSSHTGHSVISHY